MKSAAFDAQSQWRNISLSLGLSNSTMRIIYEPGSGECLHEVLSLWIQTGKDALYHLLKALENPMVARRDITHTIHARKEEERIKVSLDPAPEMDTGNKQPQGACDKISKVEVLILSTRNYSHAIPIYCYYYRDINADDRATKYRLMHACYFKTVYQWCVLLQ